MNFFILFIGIAIASYVVSASLKNKFGRYSKIPVDNGMTGAEVAMKMLQDNGIFNVTVEQVEGQLTDHYNPVNKTVNLSRDVYYGNSIAAAAVAAHECGHAVQHATNYSFLQLRSNLVPAVNFASNLMPWILLAGIFSIHVFPQLMLIGIILYAITTLFSFVTLPVEIDASQRAIAWLSATGITSGERKSQAQDALKAAAYTYVVAALASLATLIYYTFMFLGNRRD